MSQSVYLSNTTFPAGNHTIMMEWAYEMPLLLQPLLISGGFIDNDILYYDARPGIENIKRFYNFLDATKLIIHNKPHFIASKNKLFKYLDGLEHPYFSVDARQVFNMEEIPPAQQAAVWQADIAYNNAIITSAIDNNDISLLSYNKLKHVSMAFQSFSELLNYVDYHYGWGPIYQAPPREEAPSITQKNGKWGLLAADGTLLIDFKYEKIEHLYDDVFILKKDGSYSLAEDGEQFDLIIHKAIPPGFAWAFKGSEIYLIDQYGISRANKSLVQQEANNDIYAEEVREKLLAYANTPDGDMITDAYTPVEELYNIGVDAYNRHDYTSAIHYYTLAAQKGYAYAMNNLAYIYYMVDGYIDNEQAFYWYDQGAAAGNTNAINGLSLCYQHGIGTQPDIEKAIDLLYLAAKDGMASAHNNLGLLLYENDPEQALYHYHQAAALGEPDYDWLGFLYKEKGDIARAIEYFNTAIDNGYDDSHIELARIYLFEEGFIDNALAKEHIAAAEKAGLEIPDDLHS
ncbi:SEL1-like repeat protein [Chitinophaga sancti]|uniref:SEL1-like repeat protein n=1 Tax=Chitinophaga sancti TaxID=1004 RepID=UPI003F7AE0BE